MTKIKEKVITLKDLGLDGKDFVSIEEIHFAMEDFHRKVDIRHAMSEDERFEAWSEEDREEFARNCVKILEKNLGLRGTYWEEYWNACREVVGDEYDSFVEAKGLDPVTDTKITPSGDFVGPIDKGLFTKLLHRVDFSWEIDRDIYDRPCIALTDNQGGSFGGIESERFFSPEEVIKRMDIYWADEFLPVDASDPDRHLSYEEAQLAAANKGRSEDVRLLSLITGDSAETVLDKIKITKISIYHADAIEHLRLLWENGLILKNKDGKYAVWRDTGKNGPEGWYAEDEADLAKDLKEDLNGLDFIREKFRENNIPCPELEGFILHRKNGDRDLLEFSGCTACGEPQGWLYKPDGSSIEVTYEKEGLEEKDYYFSARLHCNEEDFENDVYHSTCGIIMQGGSDSLSALQDMIITQFNKEV